MEKHRIQSILAANLLAVTSLSSCVEIDSYLNDPSNVQCDGKRTMSKLSGDGRVTFIVHGKENKELATVTVRRKNDQVSVKVNGSISGPPQELEADGFTKPTPIVEGPELSAYGAGGAWVIDARKNSIVIQGNCN